MFRRLMLVLALTATVFAAGAAVASAHVEVGPEEAVAGSTTTLTFTFHHGKDGTATTGLEVLLPDGATVVEVPEVAGWTSEVDEAEGTVAWSGGSVADGVEGRFPVVVQLPAEPGVALFKTIQTTDAGELAWIEEEDGHEEGSYPAPRVTLVADPDAASTTTTADPSGSTSTTERPAGTTVEVAQRDDGDNSPAPWLIGSGIAALAAIGIGGALLRRRAG